MSFDSIIYKLNRLDEKSDKIAYDLNSAVFKSYCNGIDLDMLDEKSVRIENKLQDKTDEILHKLDKLNDKIDKLEEKIGNVSVETPDQRSNVSTKTPDQRSNVSVETPNQRYKEKSPLLSPRKNKKCKKSK